MLTALLLLHCLLGHRKVIQNGAMKPIVAAHGKTCTYSRQFKWQALLAPTLSHRINWDIHVVRFKKFGSISYYLASFLT